MPQNPWVVNGSVRTQRHKPREPREKIQVSPGPAFSKEVQVGGHLFSGIQRQSGASRKEVSILGNGTVESKHGAAVALSPPASFPTLSSPISPTHHPALVPKLPAPSALLLLTLLLTWTLRREEEGPFCSVAAYSFLLKMSPNLTHQKQSGGGGGGHKGPRYTFFPSRPLVSARKGLRMPSNHGEGGKEGGKGSTNLRSDQRGIGRDQHP